MSTRYHATPALVRAAAAIDDNPEQLAVYTGRMSQVVLAGPGSGKTHVLSATVARLLAEEVAPPQAVACVTYSNECVREIRGRLRRLGVSDAHNAVVATVHGFCLRHVLLPFARLARDTGALGVWPDGAVVVSEEQRGDLMNEAARAVLGPDERAWAISRYDLGPRVTRLRARAIERRGAAWEAEAPAVRAVVSWYEAALASRGLVDFETIVLGATTLVREYDWVRDLLRARFPVLVVDEYQDLGVALDAMVLALVRDAGIRLLAVGDADQSVYGFNGTAPELLDSLAGRLGVTPTRLRFNYRAGHKLVRASALALGESRDYEARVEHEGEIFFHRCPRGLEEQVALACRTIVPEIQLRHPATTLGQIAVLYPSHEEGTAVADAAAKRGLPVQRIDNGAPYRKTPFTRWLEHCAAWSVAHASLGTAGVEAPIGRAAHAPAPSFGGLVAGWEAAVLYERRLQRAALDEHRERLVEALADSTDGDEPLSRWLARLTDRFITPMLPTATSYDDIRGQLARLHAASEDGALAAATVSSFARQIGNSGVLNLMTLHSAKGLEFDSVILVGLDQGRLPRWNARTPDQVGEARRLFYVGLTRARREVHLAYSGFTVDKYGRRHADGPSPFLRELQRRLDAEKN